MFILVVTFIYVFNFYTVLATLKTNRDERVIENNKFKTFESKFKGRNGSNDTEMVQFKKINLEHATGSRNDTFKLKRIF